MSPQSRATFVHGICTACVPGCSRLSIACPTTSSRRADSVIACSHDAHAEAAAGLKCGTRTCIDSLHSLQCNCYAFESDHNLFSRDSGQLAIAKAAGGGYECLQMVLSNKVLTYKALNKPPVCSSRSFGSSVVPTKWDDRPCSFYCCCKRNVEASPDE